MPHEVLELILMEKFGWTPQQIDKIPYLKVKQILDVMNIRAKVQSDHQRASEALDGASDKMKEELRVTRKQGGIKKRIPV